MSFNVYKSSAGSGKTFTLVKEYLKLSIPDPNNFRHILAITFTNKAANEMKQRIIARLNEMANFSGVSESGELNLLMSEITQSTGLSADQVSKNAHKTLQNILHNYSDFAVSTIDSFMHRVIKTFAFDLKIPLNFEVEMDQDELLKKVIDILISRVGSDDQLTRILVDFILSRTDDEKGWNIENEILYVAEYITKEESKTYLEKLSMLKLADFYEINRKIEKKVRDFENTIADLADHAVLIINAKDIPNEAFYQGKNGIGTYFENLKKKRFDKVEPNSYVLKTIENDQWISAKASVQDSNSIDEIKPWLIEIYAKIIDHLNRFKAQYIVFKEISKNIYPIALLNELTKVLDEYKSENEIVLISEFNERISGIVFNEPVPFIYERLGEKYRHFLIDEFQDTSLLQWLNLLPLIENSLATEQFNMVVGDGKQAIYRWRGGEVEQFSNLPHIYKCPENSFMMERQKSLERNYKPQVLEQNYRSKTEIVTFNNDLFSFLRDSLPVRFQPIYQDVKQDSDPMNTGGLIHVEFYNKEESEFTFNEFNLKKIAEIIAELKTDDFRYNDIAILCRSNKNANEVAGELLKNEIPVISSESLFLGGSPEVRFIIAVMRLLVNQNDRIAQVEIIRFLLEKGDIVGELNENLSTFGIHSSKSKGQQDRKDFFNLLIKQGFDLRFFRLKYYTLYNLAEELIRVFKLNTKINAYIPFFLDAVLKFSREQSEELSGFLEWWDDKGKAQSIIIPEGINAVQVMTIHKAKGLQFPVVIYPFANEKHGQSNDKLWIGVDDEEIPDLKAALVNTSRALQETRYSSLYEEERDKSLLDLINLLYVVMTRPKNRMYVLTSMPAKSTDTAQSVPLFFKQYLESRGWWNDGQRVFIFGEKSKSIRKEKASTEKFNLDQIISSSWQNRMMLSLQGVKIMVSEKQKYQLQRGSQIHYILSKLNNAEELESVLSDLIIEGVINPADKNQIQAEIEKFLYHPDVYKYFQKGLMVKTEPEIINLKGEVFRPDRILVEKDHVTIIDFKTGKPADMHKLQVKNYKDLLKEMGFSKIRGVLLYINESNPEMIVEG